jgi:hypothetical protein
VVKVGGNNVSQITGQGGAKAQQTDLLHVDCPGPLLVALILEFQLKHSIELFPAIHIKQPGRKEVVETAKDESGEPRQGERR